jgi:hypothetical protein
MKSIKRLVLLLQFIFVFFLMTGTAHAATLSLSPSTGTFSVGSTFDVSIFMDTNGKSVNALAISLDFPPDMLQVVSPSLGQSVIGVWTSAPRFDNTNGKISLQGGIPGGITASDALISTVTFRVKSVGTAIVKFLDGSKTLLNDGLGTNSLSQTTSAVFNLKLPPPAGPTLASETNPDQSQWYPKRTVSFSFGSGASGIQGYSYTLSDDPATIPDDINQGIKNSVTYTDLANGIHFFHIKSLRDGVWGGTTHYSVKIDSSPPANFELNISPSSHTSNHEPIIQFSTTDSFSGIDHYEMKIVPLSGVKSDTLFTEVTSPYLSPSMEKGSYDVIIRAYDKAHNYREVTKRLVISNALFSFIDDDGVRFGDTVMPWMWVWLILIFAIGGSVYGGYRAHKFHTNVHVVHQEKKLPENVADQLAELKKFRAKYGAKALVAILGILTVFSLNSNHVQAQNKNQYQNQNQTQTSPLSPPVISTVSKNISNEEIFYLGGRTDVANEDVIIYIQNLDNGQTLTEETVSDKDANWFYRHSTFLAPGNYQIWVQGKIASEVSPPGPQTNMKIDRKAIQFGSNRLNYETIYLVLIIILILILLMAVVFIMYHYNSGKRKHKLFLKQVSQAEESIRRGFALLRRDIEGELSVIKKASLAGPLSNEEKEKQARLLADLDSVQKYVGREMWEIEHSDPN